MGKNGTKKKFNSFWAISAGIVLVVIEQLIKFLINRFYPQLPSKNPGIIFGLIDDSFWIIVFLVIGFMFLYFLYRDWKKTNFISQFSLVLITSGAISNVIDRIFYNGAIDYIHFHLWSSFNLADCYIVFGIIIYVWQLLKPSSQK